MPLVIFAYYISLEILWFLTLICLIIYLFRVKEIFYTSEYKIVLSMLGYYKAGYEMNHSSVLILASTNPY